MATRQLVRAPAPPGRPRRRRVRVVLGTVAVLGLLVVAGVVAVGLRLEARLDRIDGAFASLAQRPAGAPGETILMVGTRPGGSGDVDWLPGSQSIDSVMLVELDPRGTLGSVESLPLGAFTAADASARPDRAVAEAESRTGRRVDHLLALDWRALAQLAADNDLAATYRYGSAPAVQLDYLQQVMEGTLHAEFRKHPLDLHRALSTVASGAAVDEEWSPLEMARLMLHLRNLRTQDIGFSVARSSVALPKMGETTRARPAPGPALPMI
ncbi:hypothetical protein [Nocardioides sp.]|uniref:hypothetical protein n=1 Tax=Nocardioides sp. TaxID=35761 RepID=UPI00262EC7BF|nr:hypothetical protein [Nocardioides sp.]MCW2739264.1 LytR family transcriptional regulator [Nocardioides sp.]